MVSRRKQIQTYDIDDIRIMQLGEVDIWDGADLALIRDSLVKMVEEECRDRVGIDMSAVKYVPSGFFGMLFDWHDRGVGIYLVDPLPNVRRMLWFRRFAASLDYGLFVLTDVPQEDFTAAGVGHWRDVTVDDELCESSGRR